MKAIAKFRIKIITFILTQAIICIGYISGLFNPYEMYKSIFSGKMTDLIILLAFIFLYSLSIFIIMNFNLTDKYERIFFFVTVFITAYILIISPGLFSRRLSNSDSAFHLYICRLIISGGKPPEGFYYTDFLYHKFFSFFSLVFYLNLHSIFLFLPQLISFTIIFLGSFKFMQQDGFENNLINKGIFSLIIFHPTISVFTQSHMKPFFFIISLMPITLYFVLDLDKKKFVIIILLILVAISTHIYGFVYFFLIILMMGVKKLIDFAENKTINLTYKQLLFSNWVIYFFFLFFFFINQELLNQIIQILSDLTPIPASYKDRFFQWFYSGGLLSINTSLDSLGELIFFILDFFPVLFVFVWNQIIYLYYIKSNKKIEYNRDLYLEIFSNYFILLIVVGFFFGRERLDLWRLSYFVAFLYFFLFLKNASLLLRRLEKGIKSFNFPQPHQRLFINIKTTLLSSSFTKVSVLSIVVVFIFLPFQGRTYYTQAQYDAASWISENLPDNAIILTDRNSYKLILGLTMRQSIQHCNDLFTNPNETRAIENFYQSIDYDNSGYILLDLLNYQQFEHQNSTFPFGFCGGYQRVLHRLYTSPYYNLLYNRSSIQIYFINHSIEPEDLS